MRIGITGSIACGKSTVAGYLRSLGYCVVDADAVSRELTAENGRAIPAVRETFPECVHPDGTLNRKALGARVFHDPLAKKQLEHILHPMIFEEIDRQMDAAGGVLVFADIPLLFECGMEGRFDEVWVVTLDPSLQMKRLMERDHLSEEEARARIDSQMPQQEKAARATRCISTDGTTEETRVQVDEILSSLSAASRRRRRRESPPAEGKSVSAPPPTAHEDPPRRRAAVRKSTDSAGRTIARQERIRTAKRTIAQESTPTAERVVAQPVRRFSSSVRCILFALILLMLVLATVSGVRSFTRYQAEKRRIAAEEAERAQHPLYYGDLILQYSASQNLDPALVAGVILCESSFNPKAVSSLGARGLMQLMEDTAAWIAHKLGEDTKAYSFDRLYDPETNIRFGTWYLGYLSRRYNGDAKKVVCAYHAGQGNVDAWLKKPEYSEDGVNLTTIPTEDTSRYAGRVLKAKAVYEKYYFDRQNDPLSGNGIQTVRQ
ncbi:MAG: dephospho-CoA kinase [Clostridia bacterium]|nr:dephospho-CoA kinase [Clostridia bacterium]